MGKTDISLLDIMLKVKKHLIWIIVAALLGGAGAYAVSTWLMTPVYTADASMCVIAGKRESSTLTTSELAADNSLANTYCVLMTSQPVMEQVSEKLNGRLSTSALTGMVQTNVANDAQIIYLQVKSSNPQLSVDIAEAVLEVAPEVVPALAGGGEVKAVNHALGAPKTAPSTRGNVVLGIFIGAVAAFALIVVAALFDTTLWREEDLERAFQYPVLGCIPSMTEGEGKTPRKKG